MAITILIAIGGINFFWNTTTASVTSGRPPGNLRHHYETHTHIHHASKTIEVAIIYYQATLEIERRRNKRKYDHQPFEFCVASVEGNVRQVRLSFGVIYRSFAFLSICSHLLVFFCLFDRIISYIFRILNT